MRCILFLEKSYFWGQGKSIAEIWVGLKPLVLFPSPVWKRSGAQDKLIRAGGKLWS